MSKEKKFRELSDEELKNVNGGINVGPYIPLFFYNDVLSGGACPDGMKDENGNCPQK